jgi:hypothetical protein
LTLLLRKDGFQALQAKAILLLQVHLLPPLPPPLLLRRSKPSDHLLRQIPKTNQTPIWNLWFAR